MKEIEEYLKNSESSEYYKQEIDKLNKEEKIRLENLLQKMDNVGAKKPIAWALSEITENIPQFGRFIFLKGLFDIITDIEENILLADDIGESYEGDTFDTSKKLKEVIGEAELNNFLISYGKGMMWQIVNQIDEGNYNTKGEPMWSLKEFKDGNTTERSIGGLHESFSDFEDELK